VVSCLTHSYRSGSCCAPNEMAACASSPSSRRAADRTNWGRCCSRLPHWSGGGRCYYHYCVVGVGRHCSFVAGRGRIRLAPKIRMIGQQLGYVGAHGSRRPSCDGPAGDGGGRSLLWWEVVREGKAGLDGGPVGGCGKNEAFSWLFASGRKASLP